MSSIHGRRTHTVATRSNSSTARGRGSSNNATTLIPVRHRSVAATTRRTHQSPSATRQTRAATNATVPVRFNAAHAVQSSTQVREEIIDLTCNTTHRTARRAQPPVVLGRGARTRAAATHLKSTPVPSLKKRPTTEEAIDASPKKKYRNLRELTCPVCFDDISLDNHLAEKRIFSTKCGHLFCKPCILACLEKNNLCPICRKFQLMTDVHPIYIDEAF